MGLTRATKSAIVPGNIPGLRRQWLIQATVAPVSAARPGKM
ncbi:hypothetical protein CSC17_4245 [Klebsiella oxytoca]|nr:hypothetical protein CSC17_4245 [Klebsiella oxytoca]